MSSLSMSAISWSAETQKGLFPRRLAHLPTRSPLVGLHVELGEFFAELPSESQHVHMRTNDHWRCERLLSARTRSSHRTPIDPEIPMALARAELVNRRVASSPVSYLVLLFVDHANLHAAATG